MSKTYFIKVIDKELFIDRDKTRVVVAKPKMKEIKANNIKDVAKELGIKESSLKNGTDIRYVLHSYMLKSGKIKDYKTKRVKYRFTLDPRITTKTKIIEFFMGRYSDADSDKYKFDFDKETHFNYRPKDRLTIDSFEIVNLPDLLEFISSEGTKYKYGLMVDHSDGQRFWTFYNKSEKEGSEHTMLPKIGESEYTTGSDVKYKFAGWKINKLMLVKGDKVFEAFVEGPTRSGKFFKYTCDLNFDLSRYGVFKNIDRNNYKEYCFMHALRMSGKCDLQKVKEIIKTPKVSTDRIKEIANRLDVSIKLRRMSGKSETTHTFNKESEVSIEIGLLDEHYFINEKCGITKYALKNYNKIKHLNEWWKMGRCSKGKYYKKAYKGGMSSYQLIKKLLSDKKHLKEIKQCDEMEATHILPKNIDISQGFHELKVYKTKKDTFLKIGVSDFETIPHSDKYHETYNVGIKNLDGSGERIFRGSDITDKYLTHLFIEKYNLIYFHNLKYDATQIIRNTKKFKICSYLERKGQLYSFKVYGKGHYIEFRDSYKLMPFSIAKIAKDFNLGILKDIFPYEYLIKLRFERYGSIEDALNYVKDKAGFVKTIQKFRTDNPNEFDMIKFSNHYCMLDIEILRRSLNLFYKSIKEITRLNVFNYLTITSLTYDYFMKEGVYNNVYKLGGSQKRFIQKCVVGGQVYTRNGKKFAFKNNRVTEEEKNILEDICEDIGDDYMEDFDAVGLYGSAIYFLRGYLMGIPKLMKKEDLNRKDISGFFIRIKITKFDNIPFPLVYERVDGSIKYLHTSEKPVEMYVDDIYLEELKINHNIEFEFIEGLYFDKGLNTKSCEVMKHLFESRLEYKKTKNNAMSCVLKLMMNSSYGRTILTECLTENKIMSWKQMKDTFANHFHRLKSITCLDKDKYIVKMLKESTDKHTSMPHIGSRILSKSKQIMNKVFRVARENNINIYYKDTDSMHIFRSSLELLKKKFPKTIDPFTGEKRGLVGKYLGQFHTDFAISGEDASSDICVLLGKKTYYDRLRSKNKTAEHIRMKGVCTDLPKLSDYVKLFKGQKVTFDLTKSEKPSFEYKDLRVQTRTKFERTLQFE